MSANTTQAQARFDAAAKILHCGLPPRAFDEILDAAEAITEAVGGLRGGKDGRGLAGWAAASISHAFAEMKVAITQAPPSCGDTARLLRAFLQLNMAALDMQLSGLGLPEAFGEAGIGAKTAGSEPLSTPAIMGAAGY